MAENKKVNQLNILDELPASDDKFVVWDESAQETKHVSRENLLGEGVVAHAERTNNTHGIADDSEIVGIKETQTLENKTLISPTISNKTSTGTDNGEETLENKTLIAPDLTGDTTSENLNVSGDFELDGDVVELSEGGTGVNLTAPSEDKIMFYDHSAGETKFAEIGTGLQMNDDSLQTTGSSIEVAVFHDQKTEGTSGGTSLTTFTARDLNTTVYNNITGCSLSSNQITLPAGDYLIFATVPSYYRKVKSRFYNVTDSSVDIIGTSQYLNTAINMNSIINGVVSIASTKTFEIQMRASTVQGNGLGEAVSLGEPEVYTTISITKIA